MQEERDRLEAEHERILDCISLFYIYFNLFHSHLFNVALNEERDRMTRLEEAVQNKEDELAEEMEKRRKMEENNKKLMTELANAQQLSKRLQDELENQKVALNN